MTEPARGDFAIAQDKTKIPPLLTATEGFLHIKLRNEFPDENYFSTASLNAFAGRRRTTVLALILICSPVWGLRPKRALR